MKFWLDKGVDGVMVEGSHTLFEVDDLTLDEPPEEKDVIRVILNFFLFFKKIIAKV